MRLERTAVLTLLLAIIILSAWTIPTNAQYDDFPIGMNLTYVVYTALPGGDNEFQNVYEFIRWEHQENLTVEYEIDTVQHVKQLHEIRMFGPDLPPLWMDVSSWSIGNRIEISGREFPIIMMEDVFTGPPGSYECYRLESIVQDETRRNATSFWYHAELGLLLDYLRTDEQLPSNELIKMSSTFVIDGNFHYFDPPTFTVPVTITTTTTTTIPPDTTTSTPPTSTPPQQTSTTSTSSSTQRGYEPPIGLTETFVIGIVIEIFVILIFVRAKLK